MYIGVVIWGWPRIQIPSLSLSRGKTVNNMEMNGRRWRRAWDRFLILIRYVPCTAFRGGEPVPCTQHIYCPRPCSHSPDLAVTPQTLQSLPNRAITPQTLQSLPRPTPQTLQSLPRPLPRLCNHSPDCVITSQTLQSLPRPCNHSPDLAITPQTNSPDQVWGVIGTG